MSETDDTDVLLLIPPDFFLVHTSGSEDSLLESSRTVVHKPQSCTAQVIGKLVNQVHTLESRLESLEISTTITDTSFGTIPRRKNWDTDSFESRSLDSKFFTFPRRRKRKIARKARKPEHSLTSLDSLSFRREIPPLELKGFEVATVDSKTSQSVNDSPSMDGDISSIGSTPNKKNDKLLLNEIDEFLTKVEAYETPDANYKEIETSVSPENVIKATGDYISRKIDSRNDDVKLPSGRTISNSVLDKYIYLVKSTASTARTEHTIPSTSVLKTQYDDETNRSQPVTISETPKVTENSKLSDTKSPNVRRLNFSDKDVQPTSTPKKPHLSNLDSFKPSSSKIYDRASKVLEHYKSQNYSHNSHSTVADSYMLSREEFKMPQMRPFVDSKEILMKNKLIESIDTDLLSLSELWGEKGEKERERQDSGKLEEERLKREHCEAIIQQLQKKMLDQQEKLAVALKVDRAKDAVIAKLKDAWLKLTGSLDKAEDRHRAGLEKMLREVDNFKLVANEAQKKTNHFETELYKALDLAHDYQDKCKQLTSHSKELQERMDTAIAHRDEIIARKDSEIEVLHNNYETLMCLNKQSTDCVKNLEDALEKEKTDHDLTKAKGMELLHKLQSTGDETSLVAQERDLLRDKLNEERARVNMLERQLGEKQDQNCDLLKKCDNLDTELKSLRKNLEQQKNELKTHYQKQLEDAVLAKLQEFQHQLDLAEKEMENDARGKENAIVDSFNKQMGRIEEQHRLEVNVLEEKQREEIKLYRLQLAQASEKIGLLESKLESYRRRRGQIASQLHGVMEAQWRQALLILTNGNPAASSLDLTRADSVSTPAAQDYAPPKIPPLTLPTFDKRLQRPEREDKMFNFEGLSDTELQQYVKLLLTKPPTLDGSGDAAADAGEEPTSDRNEHERRPKRSLTHTSHKPPWKA